MKHVLRLVYTIALLCLPLGAYALEEGAGVEVVTLLKTTESWDGASIAFPQGRAEITALRIEIAPGVETGWHRHPLPSFAILLEGTLELTLRDGRVKRLQAGEALAEVVDTAHNGRNVGDTPVRIVVFYAGAVGQALTIRETGD